MTFLGNILWYCSYFLQGFDTGLNTRYSVQHNKIILNSVPEIYSNKAYLQVFYYEFITFFKLVKIFERMGISESIYEVLVETYF